MQPDVAAAQRHEAEAVRERDPQDARAATSSAPTPRVVMIAAGVEVVPYSRIAPIRMCTMLCRAFTSNSPKSGVSRANPASPATMYTAPTTAATVRAMPMVVSPPSVLRPLNVGACA